MRVFENRVARNIFVSKRDEVRRDSIIWHNLCSTHIKYGVIKWRGWNWRGGGRGRECRWIEESGNTWEVSVRKREGKKQTAKRILLFCWPCISVYLSQYLITLMKIFHNKFYFISLHVSSTCAHHQEVGVMIPEVVWCNFDLLMQSTMCSKHVEK